MIQRSIHYKSDFKLRLANEIDWSTPFKARFFTTRPVSAMEVSYDGTTYKGCRVDEDGKLVVTFDRFTQLHRQGLGNLMMELSYNIDDDQFADNSFDRILAPQKVVCIDDEDNEFELVLGLNGDSHVEVECSVIAAYKKGDPGDTPEIGENGNWWIGGVDTEVKADYSSEEALRQSQEAARVAAETTRQSNETQRQSGETTRQSNEATRQSKETERQTNETARQNAEAQRQQTFQTNEAARQTAYQNAEANRNGAYQEAEQDRNEEFASKEATRDAANQAALNCAETLAALGPKIDKIYGGDIDRWHITDDSGYIGANGNHVSNERYSSCLIQMIAGNTYKIVQQRWQNYVRIFRRDNDAYTQTSSYGNNSSADAVIVYTCPNDGNTYYIQCVHDSAYDSQVYPQVYANGTFEETLYIKAALSLNDETPEPDVASKKLLVLHGYGKTISQQYFNSANSVEAGLMTAEMYNNSFTESAPDSLEDIFEITTTGGYINASGNAVSDNRYNSCLMQMTKGHTYRVVQQSTALGNNLRVFSKSGNTYTQVECIAGDQSDIGRVPQIDYYCANDNYWIQVIIDTLYTGTPIIYDVSPVKTPLKNIVELLKAKVDSSKKTLKLLAIGNSYSRDALSYVPFLLKSVLNMDVIIGILYKGSCTLQQHYSLISSDGDYEAYDEYDNTTDAWTTTTTGNLLKVSTILARHEWDIVTLQQQSSASRDYTTYQPYLNNIISNLLARLTYNVKFGWILTPAYPTGYSGLSGDTSDEMFNKICTAAGKVMDETSINFFIPCGTAIQNARHSTTLKDLGDFGGLSYEGLHLQEGIPCLLEAYVATQYILNLMESGNKGVFGNQIRPIQSWVSAKAIPQANGQSVGVTDANCTLAQKIAAIAIKKPLVITDIDALGV